MTRDQMIAHLELHGWEPTRAYHGAVQRGHYRIYTTATYEGVKVWETTSTALAIESEIWSSIEDVYLTALFKRVMENAL